MPLDDKLIDRARRAGGNRTKRRAVTAALDKCVRHHRQLEVIKLFGTIDFDPSYDYKAVRRRDGKRIQFDHLIGLTN